MSFPKYIVVTVILAGLTTYFLAPSAVEERFNEFNGVEQSCPEELDSFLESHVELSDESNVDLKIERSNTSEFSTSSRNLRCEEGSEEGQNVDHYYCTPSTDDLEIEYSELDEEGNIEEQETLLINHIELDSEQAYIGYNCQIN